jgi:hypothetical protein
MDYSIWRPKWWVFLPVSLPLLAFLWFRLGQLLQLQIVPSAHGATAPASYPAWLVAGYSLVQRGLWILLSPGALVVLRLVDPATVHVLPGEIMAIGVLVSIAIDCLLLYGILMVARWAGRPGYVKD